MNLPANIRVNTQANFPSLVYGSGLITIGKANGIWTVGWTMAPLGAHAPLPANYATDFLVVWDSVLNTYYRTSFANVISTLSIITGARVQRTTTTTPIVVAPGDGIISCKITSPASCILPSAASRLGVPLTFKDLGQAATNHITLTVTGTDLIDGLTTAVLTMNFQAITLVPFNDGTNTGWMLQ